MNIPLFKPKIRFNEIKRDLEKMMDSGWLSRGPKTQKFEEEIKKYLGCKYFLPTNSGTSALHLVIKALKLRNNSQVLTTPITFASTNFVLLQEKLTPLFYDIEKETGNASLSSIKELYSKNPEIKLLIIVHFAGYPCNLNEIRDFCKNNKIHLLEDSAHAMGSSYNNKKIGFDSSYSCFSFQAVKNLTCGDGGGIALNDPKQYALLKELSFYGCDKDSYSKEKQRNISDTPWKYDIKEQGLKYNMNDLNAIIALNSLKHLDEDNAIRKKIALKYRENIKGFGLPEYLNDRESNYHFLPIFTKNRIKVFNFLKELGILCGVHYERNDKLTIFKSFFNKELKNVEIFSNEELTLPMFIDMTELELEYIIEKVNKASSIWT